MNLILIFLVLLLIGAFPPLGLHSWGYSPFGVILIVLLLLILTGRL